METATDHTRPRDIVINAAVLQATSYIFLPGEMAFLRTHHKL